MADLGEVRKTIAATVDSWAAKLIEVSHEIHANPELRFEEHHAHRVLTDLLSEAGLEVERHAYGLQTAFAARAGSKGPTVAVLCEYDALEGVGHACGHNLIAAAGVGAGLAAAAVAQQLGGRLLILGTPAEEGGGGKVDMLDAGAFEGVDAAMMIHPADADLTRMDTIAVAQYRATYTGRASHAAAAPQLGRNALDAAVLGYNNVAALRQHILPGERIHGIFTEAGEAANVVPQRAVANWMVRSPTLEGVGALTKRVQACLRAGAEAAGCEVEIVESARTYADMVDNQPLLDIYAANSALLNRPLAEPDATHQVVGSTDMGNVSHAVPSIHPMVQVAPPGVSIHTTNFASAAIGPDADRAMLDAAQAMAMTVADLWADADLLSQVRAAYENS